MKKRLSAAFCLFITITIQAQVQSTIISENERNACFFYALTESPINRKCKIMFVSTYIYREKYEKSLNVSDKLSNACQAYYGYLLNAFNKKMDQIESEETVTDQYGTHVMVIRSTKVSSYYGNYPEGHCPIDGTDLVLSDHQSTASYSNECREKFIKEKMAEGYSVFQVTFDEYYNTEDPLLYSAEDFRKVVDEVEDLSASFVQPYYGPGDVTGLSCYNPYKRESYNNTYNNNNSDNSGTMTQEEAQSIAEVFELLQYANWEATGGISMLDYANPSGTGPNVNYFLAEAKLNFKFGWRRFKFDVAPAGISWVAVPSFDKFDLNGNYVGQGDFGLLRLYSPTVGFSYMQILKKEREEEYRKWEFPMSIAFTPLFFPDSPNIIQRNENDTPVADYFDGLKFNLNLTGGVNFFLTDRWGAGLSFGGIYIHVQGTSNTIIETDEFNQPHEFTFKMHDLIPFLPYAQVRIIFRS